MRNCDEFSCLLGNHVLKGLFMVYCYEGLRAITCD
jgi:hypothetical protein